MHVHWHGAWFALSAACLFVVVAGFGYDENESKAFASLSSLTYCDDLSKVYNWTCVPCKDSNTRLAIGKIKIIDGGSHNATRVLIGKLADQAGCLVAFRGSDDIFNWVRDVEVYRVLPRKFEKCEGCKVHSGFYTIWEKLRTVVTGALSDVGCVVGGNESLLHITGHSLGAALTHLSMFDLEDAGYRIAKSYSFEAPRIGNEAFAKEFYQRFSRLFPVFRITHYKDPVVHLPPEAAGYRHVQTEVYYNRTGQSYVADEPEDMHGSNQFGDLPGLVLFHAGDHCRSPLVPNGDLCNPVGCAAAAAEIIV